jgi:hypothetical protein
MSLDKNVVDLALNKKFSDFADTIKQDLESKLAAHADYANYKTEMEKISDMKKAYNDISAKYGEKSDDLPSDV